MRNPREIRRWRHRGKVANCRPRGNAQAVPPPKTPTRVRLGAELAYLRKRSFSNQKELADKVGKGLGVKSISTAESGGKVRPSTMRMIERGLGLPFLIIDKYLAGEIEHLPGWVDDEQPAPASAFKTDVLAMTRAELFDAILVVEKVSGPEVADRVLKDALDKRAQSRRTDSGSVTRPQAM